MTDYSHEYLDSLVAELELLASPPSVQEEWLKAGPGGVDEMRLGLLDVGSNLFPLYREQKLIDSLDEAAIERLEEHLNAWRFGPKRPAWHVDSGPFWTVTRELASDALATLNRHRGDALPESL
jgi:hypothetical protein